MGKVGGKLNAYVRDAISGPSYVIPPVNEYHGSQGGAVSLTAAEKMEKKKGRGPLTDLEIEDAIGDLFDYFNDTFGTLKENLSSEGGLFLSPEKRENALTSFLQPGISSSLGCGRIFSPPSRASSFRLCRIARPR